MIPVVRDSFYNDFPDWFKTIFHSGISAGAITAILLNLLLNSDKQRALYEAEEGSTISGHDAVRQNPMVEPYGEAAQIPQQVAHPFEVPLQEGRQHADSDQDSARKR
jgi:NCS2 family nucleobase:cation symporter-2